jgi:nickel-dependent lactate racemase
MKIRLAYGRDGLTIDVPDRNLAGILKQSSRSPLEDPVSELEQQLQHPRGTSPLLEKARGASSAVVVISDITRPVPNTLLLPPILRTLREARVPRERTTILIATGLHRSSTVEELSRLVGGTVNNQYRVESHHARAIDEQRFLGHTQRGTPVYIDERYCAADLKITTGFIEPHLMAGFSGGRKLVAPGCAGEATIKALHSPKFLEHPNCREGCIDGNPLHDELLAIAAMAGHDFIVNVSLDADHAVTGMFVGDPLLAHAEGVARVREMVGAKIDREADIVVTTSAGYPLDLTYYQAVKGMTAALPVVREGGTMIIAAECAEGLGSKEFSAMATEYPTSAGFVHAIMERPVVIDQWQLEEAAKAARKAKVVLVSGGIPEHQKSRLFVESAPTVEHALEEALRRYGPQARVAVIPQGPYTLVGTNQPPADN